MKHIKNHRTHRIGWLRATVLGANYGIVSTAGLVLGMVATGAIAQKPFAAVVATLL
jgi:VIT1/CCC1 family predicted Fe2+/Mn2+ transporter